MMHSWNRSILTLQSQLITLAAEALQFQVAGLVQLEVGAKGVSSSGCGQR